MTSPNFQITNVPATSDAQIAAQAASSAAQIVEGQRTPPASIANNQQIVLPAQAPMNAAHLNTPLAGSLNSKEPMFYIKATAAQLKAIIQSAPEEIRSRVRANASKESMLDEVFRLRQQEALDAKNQEDETISPQEALRQVITMDSGTTPSAVDANPQHVRKLMEAALQADTTLMPREVPEDRHNIIYTILTWQIYAHKLANPQPADAGNQQSTQPTPVPDTQPPQQPTGTNQGVANATGSAAPNNQNSTDQPVPSINDILNSGTHLPDLQDVDDSEEDPDLRRKKARTGTPMESWIEGFHTGADAALEETLSSYPENRPGANRLNITSFMGPQINEKVINRNMGLQQHVATFPFWKKTVSGAPTQPHAEAHNIARMIQLEILAHSSPLEALRHRLSLEVGLRRLYAIMWVEKQVATGEMPDRGSTWQNIEFLLESTPRDTSTCDAIEDEMIRRLTQSKRRIAATKVIKESDNRR